MPAEKGYEAQIMPRAGAPLPLSNPGTFGAQVGDAMANIGQDMHRREVRAYQIEREATRQAEASAAGTALAKFRTAQEEWEIARQQQSFDGYSNDVAERLAKAREELTAGITEDSVRYSVLAQIDAYGAAVQTRAMAWEDGQRLATGVLDKDKAWRLRSAAVARDPAKLGEEMAALVADAATIPGPDNVKAAFLDKWAKELARGAGKSLAETSPELLKAQVGAGVFDYLGADDVLALNDRADVTIRSREIAQARAQAEADAQMRAVIDDLLARQGRGEIFDDAVFAEAEARAREMGKPELVNRIAEIRDVDRVTRIYGPDNATPAQREAALAAIAAKGAGATPQELHTAQILREKSASWDVQSRADPIGAKVRAGKAAPLDMNDPASVAARVRDWRATSGGGLGDKFFSAAEAGPLQAAYAKGGNARMSVLSELDVITDDFARDAAVRQIAPRDPGFQLLAQVAPTERANVLRGQEARVGNTKLLAIDDAKNPKVGEMLRQADADVDFALRAVPPRYATAVKQLARDYYAGQLWSRGQSTIMDGFDPKEFREGQHVALGAKPRADGQMTGGLGYWGRAGGGTVDFSRLGGGRPTGAGGRVDAPTDEPGTPFIISDGYTQSEWSKAAFNDRRRQEKEGRGPVDVDGKTPFDLKYAFPRMESPGVYRWETASGKIVMNARGERFITYVWPRP